MPECNTILLKTLSISFSISYSFKAPMSREEASEFYTAPNNYLFDSLPLYLSDSLLKRGNSSRIPKGTPSVAFSDYNLFRDKT